MTKHCPRCNEDKSREFFNRSTASFDGMAVEIAQGQPTAKEVQVAVDEVRKSPSTFNWTNENIEWAKWTWNPVTGCKHGCKYCYARDIANRFNPNGFEPTFYEDRLQAPLNTKLKVGEPNNVFVVSMGDLFGEWVPDEWIEKVLDAARNAPQWNFLYLTKNPERYQSIDWPENSWIGATVDTQERADRVCRVFDNMQGIPLKFISCEPLREEIKFDAHQTDWVIIGGQSKTTQEPARQPEWEWVEVLLRSARRGGAKVYFKPNLTVRPKEYPGG